MNLDQVFGIHAAALRFRAARAEILAANLANADTPNYQARDIEFADLFRRSNQELRVTAPGHIGRGGEQLSGARVQYRVPDQAALDQNTVDAQAEHTRFMQNAIQYEASLQFLRGRIDSLMTAVRGE